MNGFAKAVCWFALPGQGWQLHPPVTYFQWISARVIEVWVVRCRGKHLNHLLHLNASSPFFGIEAARDVLIKKQLLALQEAKLEEKTWATLEDGTPLVTAEQRDAGWIVLFHVGSDAEWSNLPLSGTFVEMLRRTINLSRSQATAGSGTTEITLTSIACFGWRRGNLFHRMFLLNPL